MVERITGRLTQGRAAATGAAGGAWWGLFIGVMLLIFSTSESNGLLVLMLTLISGAVFGAVFGIIGYSLTGGKRDFTSQSSVVATSYEVLCKYQFAEDARGLLARLAMQR
jgi:hypothetical protein